MLENPQFWIGVVALCVGLGLIALMYRLEKQPRTSLNPRMLPTTLIMVVGMLIALGAAVHLLMIAGFHIPQQR